MKNMMKPDKSPSKEELLTLLRKSRDVYRNLTTKEFSCGADKPLRDEIDELIGPPQ